MSGFDRIVTMKNKFKTNFIPFHFCFCDLNVGWEIYTFPAKPTFFT